MEELSKEMRTGLLQNEINLQLSNRYVLTIRARVAKALDNKENMAICTKGLEETEMALDVLKLDMETLKAEGMEKKAE